MSIVVAAIDVGSLVNIGWWRAQGSAGLGGHDLDELIASIVADINDGTPVALGFEAPLFIPRPSTTDGLNKQRLGERGRPWCAGAGTGALALGIQQAAYVLSGIALGIGRKVEVSFDPEALTAGTAQLLIWEAFVTGKAKNRSSLTPHVDDARAAVTELQLRFDRGSVSSDLADVDVLSLAATALLVSGLTDDAGLLTLPCVVVRAPDYADGSEA